MKKVNINLNFFKRLNKKVVCMIGGAILAIAVIVTIVVLVVNGNKNNEKELNAKLEELAAIFYEGFYYDSMVKNYGVDQVANYANVGIKVSLDNLIRSSGLNKDQELRDFFVNSKTKEPCDKDNTKVTIYPQDPYEKKDYKVDIILECGFEKKDKTTTTTTTTTKKK